MALLDIWQDVWADVWQDVWGASTGTAPTVTTAGLLNGYVGTPYNATLAASGDAPITWAVTVGALPDGLALDADTGLISGTPTTEEAQTFTVTATNDRGNDTQELTLTIAAASDAVGAVSRWWLQTPKRKRKYAGRLM